MKRSLRLDFSSAETPSSRGVCSAPSLTSFFECRIRVVRARDHVEVLAAVERVARDPQRRWFLETGVEALEGTYRELSWNALETRTGARLNSRYRWFGKSETGKSRLEYSESRFTKRKNWHNTVGGQQAGPARARRAQAAGPRLGRGALPRSVRRPGRQGPLEYAGVFLVVVWEFKPHSLNTSLPKFRLQHSVSSCLFCGKTRAAPGSRERSAL